MTYDKIANMASRMGERLQGHKIVGALLPQDMSYEISWEEVQPSASWAPFDKIYRVGEKLITYLSSRIDLEHRLDAVRLLRMLQADSLYIVFECTSLTPKFEAGSYVIINDHVNCTGENPLWGPNDERFGPRYPNMTEPYDSQLSAILQRGAKIIGMPLEKAVYGRLKSIESEEKLKIWSKLGIEVMGEDVVDEVIVAAHCGLPVVALGVVGSVWSGSRPVPLSSVNPSRKNFEELTLLIKQCLH